MAMNPLRNLPSVGELLESPPLRGLLDRISRHAVTSTVRSVLDEVRSEVHNAAAEKTLPSVSELAERIARRVMETERSALEPVINATGILLDDALGRAPLAEAAVEAIRAAARDYVNLELDLASGRPARRVAPVEPLLKQITGAEAALVVNNGAGATLLACAALAAGRELIVSRGHLIAIGRSYRLSEMIAAGGAVLREVGAANQTRPDDYLEAIGPQTAALLLVHPSALALAGSAAGVTLADLVEIGRRHDLPVIHNLGPGALIGLAGFGLAGEPFVSESIKAGADLVLSSGDKLLGGPQAGIIAGRKALVDRMERHPLARAVRVGKLTLAALAATLRLYQQPDKASREVPLLHLLITSVENLRNRAERLAPQVAASGAVARAEAFAAETYVDQWLGPDRQLPTWRVAVIPHGMSVDRLAAALRLGSPPVIARVEQDRLLLDLRTVIPRQDQQLVEAFAAVGEGKS